MKMTKRIFAILIAVLLIASTAVITASAATYKMTVECSKKDYVFSVFQVATLNEETGVYAGTTNIDSINAQVIKNDSSTKDLLDACDAVDVADLGAAIGTYDTTADGVSKTFTDLAAGIYYVKCTAVAANNKSVKNSIAVLPNSLMQSDTFTFSVADKVPEKDEPVVDKKIVVGDQLVESAATGEAKTITYQLSADIAGSATNKLSSYVITDKMDAMLDSTAVTVKSVKLVGTSTSVDLAYAISNDENVINSANSTGNTFGISIKAEELDKDSFYADGNKVVVVFETKLNSTAKAGVKILNEDDLIYTNKSGKVYTVEGNTVEVYTFNVQIKKVDAENASTTLAKAKFAVYETYDATSKQLSNKLAESPETGADGLASFAYNFAPGKYYVQEIQAPEGYNLDTSVHEITVVDDFTKPVQIGATIKDTKSKLPQTGGSGTAIFTIIGASLVLLSGVMFIILMKKKTTK